MNQSARTEILLLGFQNPFGITLVLFLLFLVIYILTLVGNLLIIILVVKFQSLRSPMYIFLVQLSVCDILLTTITVPNMLHVIINGGRTISLTGCLTQLYFFSASEAAECFLLTAMSYDRYLAICCPLHYFSIMSFRLYSQLILFSWLLSCILVFIITVLISSLQFCGSVIDHYFCDFTPLLELSCTHQTFVELLDFVLGIPFLTVPFSFVIYTYVSIFIAILGISSGTGRRKAFSTCSSHLAVVCVFYWTLITVYFAPAKEKTFNLKKVLSLLYTVLCPFLNPIMYSLRNQDIKHHLKVCISNNIRINI